MEERWTVVLYGNSLLLAGVDASLRDREGLELVWIDATLPDAAQRLRALHPDVVVFDLAAPCPQFASSFLTEHPGLPVIGLDVNSSTVIVLSSQQYTALSANDLTQVIQENMSRTRPT